MDLLLYRSICWFQQLMLLGTLSRQLFYILWRDWILRFITPKFPGLPPLWEGWLAGWRLQLTTQAPTGLRADSVLNKGLCLTYQSESLPLSDERLPLCGTIWLLTLTCYFSDSYSGWQRAPQTTPSPTFNDPSEKKNTSPEKYQQVSSLLVGNFRHFVQYLFHSNWHKEKNVRPLFKPI